MRLFGEKILYQFSIHRRHLASYVKFENYLQIRRNQAEKSVLIQVSNPESANDVRTYLTSNFGPLSAIFHYSLPGQSRRIGTKSATSIEYHWVIAEFSKKSDYDKAIESCRFQEGVLPYRSSMCWFSQQLGGTKSAKEQKKPASEVPITSARLGSIQKKIDFSTSRSLSDQIDHLFESLRISEVGARVRFSVAAHLETSVKTFFPNGCVIPFGSSVSGIGQNSGDLDLVLLADKTEILKSNSVPAQPSRLRFQSKMENSGGSNARFQSQRVMETLADIITLFVPGCSQVQRILQARIPILRFWSDFTSMQCDLSMTNASGVHMSELIYMMGCIDKRFQPLLFTIRSWAAARKITNPAPGRTPTNFTLVLLLVYFLQHKKILPTFDVLFNHPADEDKRITSDGIDCTFMRDASRLQKYFTPQNRDSTLAELLFDFFEFYSEFDFTTKGISLFTGGPWGKPDAGALYIQNPLERHLNVARNVSREELTRFRNECCYALWRRETARSEEQSVKLADLLLAPPKTAGSGTLGIKVKEIFQD